MKRLVQFFPIFEWLPRYGKRDARGDLAAGLTVGIMLIPQGMAYALLAGLPPIYGLYSAIVPLLTYPFFGSSRHLAVGTMAIDSLIVAVSLGAIAESGSDSYIELALVLAILVGAIHLGMGLARLGFIVNLLSRPVIAGFTSAAALVIAFSQMKTLLGVDVPRTEFFYEMVWENVIRLNETHLISLGIGIGGILLLVGLKKWKPIFPRALAVVILGTLLVWFFDLQSEGVAIVAEIPKGLPSFHLPVTTLSTIKTLIPTAIALALIQFANVAALSKFFAAKHRYSIDPNKELVAIGAANILGGLFRSMPISGSYSRSAVNEQSGGQTALANIFAALVIVVTLFFLTPAFYFLPNAILAAIIMEAAFGMVDVKQFREIYAVKRSDGSISVLVFILTLTLGMEIAILSGIAASILVIFYRISRPRIAELGHLPHTRSFRDTKNFVHAEKIEGIIVLRVGASFTFANAEYLKDYVLTTAESRPETYAVVLDVTSVNDVDTTALSVIDLLRDTLKSREIGLYFAGVQGKVREVFIRANMETAFGKDHFYLSVHRTVLHLVRRRKQEQAYLDSLPDSSEEDTTIESGIDDNSLSSSGT